MAIRVDDVDLTRDRVLVERFQSGDTEAFDELYRRYRHRLERFCLKRLGDHHAAEEVAQEAFTRALTAMGRLDGERRFYPWVSVIAARLCVDHHRRTARIEPAAAVDLGPVDGGQEAVVDAVDLALLAQAMDHLGPRHREVLQLREMQDLSYQDIADHYQVTLGTVEALLFRARRALRREFEALGGGRIASVGILGWLGRGIARLRDDNGTKLLLGGTAAAAALAVGLAVGPGGGHPSSGRVRTLTTNTSTARLAGATGSIRPAPAGAQPGSAPPGTSPPGRSGGGGPAGKGAAAPASSYLGRALVSPAQARQEISQMPIQIHLGPVDIGLDPAGQVNHLLHEPPGASLP